MKHAQVTLRIGAAYDEVIVDGHRFDRSVMERSQRNKLRRMIVAAFEKDQRG